MVTAIATIRAPFADKFGVPRQSGLARNIESTVEVDAQLVPEMALRGLTGFSHIWLIFQFHLVPPEREQGDRETSGFRPTVRPPRLGGNRRLGVYATRSPFRINQLGLSVVELVAVEGHRLRIRGADLVDQTPILDIKPYVAYADSIPDARCDWAQHPPTELRVEIATELSGRSLNQEQAQILANACEALRFDPRPAYRSHSDDPNRVYWLNLSTYEVGFRVTGELCTIVELRPRARS